MKTKLSPISRRTNRRGAARKLSAGSRNRSPRGQRESLPFIAPILTVIE